MAKSDEHKIDPFIEFLMNAPIDDEPETPEEAAAVAEAKAEIARGEYETFTVEELRAKLLSQGRNIAR